MRLDDENYELIKKEISDLYKKYDIKFVPINWKFLTERMNIELIQYSSLSDEKLTISLSISEDGFSIINHMGRHKIFYNDKKSSTRINMTIMHEIGHIVLNHTGRNEDTEIEESEASFFAKYALAAPILVHHISPKNIENIGEIFDIGYEASNNCMNYYLIWREITKGVNLFDYDKIFDSLFIKEDGTLRMHRKGVVTLKE